MQDKKRDYKATIFLPSTTFSMKADLAKKEPEMLRRWTDQKLYQTLVESRQDQTKFVLHDGPPYANGHIHIGHALNKILKDVVNRYRWISGESAPFIPGWDCHGLPIEWEVETQYKKQGKSKDTIDLAEFRQTCRAFAENWIEVQKKEFQRLGVLADWDHPYVTMHYETEGKIVNELCKFLMNGALYRGKKPVLWSVVEKTALAEAEVEYKDHTSDAIYVSFPVLKSPSKEWHDARLVIWTTTPWTLPGNRAVAFSKNIVYAAYENIQTGEVLILAESLAQSLFQKLAGAEFKLVQSGVSMDGMICRHPLYKQGYDFLVPVLAGDFVTAEQGTGLVHIAPGHGEDDFALGQQHQIDVPDTVNEAGVFYDHVPLFSGKRVLTPYGKKGDANVAVMDVLRNEGALLYHQEMVHSYPHSWRSKAPLIFRTTAQWFIDIEHRDVQKKSIEALGHVGFYPKQSVNRLTSMIADRPDWCLSRQRSWGVPITVFVHKKTGQPLQDDEVNQRIVDVISSEGCDAWLMGDAQRFLGSRYVADDYDKITDTLDVWFDSGCTHAFVLERNNDLHWPADLYLEGSDQHRGWFQHSLIEGVATRGVPPFKNVMTHGFVLDAQGKKMSKSTGNVVAPQDVTEKYGADVLRLWVVGSDYFEDLRIGNAILDHHADIYRRIRNTLRFMLGNLAGFSESESTKPFEMPWLERWVMHRLGELDEQIRESIQSHQYGRILNLIHHFCSNDLSSFYFDIRKDCLYCDDVHDIKRRSARTVLNHLFECLVIWVAPILPFTAEEAWAARHGDQKHNTQQTSVHLQTMPDVPAHWQNEVMNEKWLVIQSLRRVVNAAIEVKRNEKQLGSNLEAHPVVYTSARIIEILNGIDPAEVCLTSALSLVESSSLPEHVFVLDDAPEIGVEIRLSDGHKCGRCWKILPEMGQYQDFDDLCDRCYHVVKTTEVMHEAS